MPTQTVVSHDLLQAALSGLELQRQKIEAHIAEVQGMLGRRGPGRPPKTLVGTDDSMPAKPQRRRRKFSAAARARMAEAQRTRWAKINGVMPVESERRPKKRRMSAEGRRRIAEAARKRWAAVKKRKSVKP